MSVTYDRREQMHYFNKLTSLSDNVINDIINEVRIKLKQVENISYDYDSMKKYADLFLFKEVQAECNGFPSESSFVNNYFKTNIHGQISSTKRNLLTDFFNFILQNVNGEDFVPYEPSLGLTSGYTFAEEESNDLLSGFSFADDEITLIKYDNFYDKKCPISDVVKVLTELVREHPGEESHFYLDKIDFYKNDILRIDHRRAFEYSISKNFKSLENDIWHIINLGNNIIIFDLK